MLRIPRIKLKQEPLKIYRYYKNIEGDSQYLSDIEPSTSISLANH